MRWGGSGYQKQHVAPHWVFEWLCKQRLKGKHPHMKCICSHYSGVSAAANTRGLTLAFAGGMCMCSYILSLNPDTKGLFEQINRLIAWYLTLSSPASTWTHEADWMIDSQIAADFLHSQRQKKRKKQPSKNCHLLLEVIKLCIRIVRMCSTPVVVSIQMHSKQQVAGEQVCCWLNPVTATLAANPCTHTTGTVPLKTRLRLKQGVINMCSTFTKRAPFT